MFSKFFSVVTNTLGGLLEGLLAYRRYQEGYRELMALDDRQLQDIGIERSMIRSVAITGMRRVGEVGGWTSNPVSNREMPKHAA